MEILDFMKELALRAGTLAASMREAGMAYTLKASSQMVTIADQAVEKLIVEEIRGRFPGHLIWAEETAAAVDAAAVFSEPLWIIDPIDGTTNYAHQQLHSAVSIAYAEGGIVKAGVVHAPFLHETYTASKGGGAHLNGDSIRPALNTPLERALIACGHPSPEELPRCVAQIGAVFRNCFDIRRLGAASIDICWVACGRLHGFWETLQPWDIAAAGLIAREAGATVGRLSPPPVPPSVPSDLNSKDFLVAAPQLFEPLKELLLKA